MQHWNKLTVQFMDNSSALFSVIFYYLIEFQRQQMSKILRKCILFVLGSSEAENALDCRASHRTSPRGRRAETRQPTEWLFPFYLVHWIDAMSVAVKVSVSGLLTSSGLPDASGKIYQIVVKYTKWP
jgi:hypothetical protein